MKCPKCSYVREDSDRLTPVGQCPKCGFVYSKYGKTTDKSANLVLTSGQTIEFSQIKLYDARRVKQLTVLYDSIDRNRRGFSTGIGVIGDVEDVVAGKLITGAVDGLVSGAMETTAAKQAADARELYRYLRSNSVAVSVGTVENIDIPQPELWRVPHFKTENKVDLIQLPGSFITVVQGGIDVAVFWDKVESYFVK